MGQATQTHTDTPAFASPAVDRSDRRIGVGTRAGADATSLESLLGVADAVLQALADKAQDVRCPLGVV